MLARFWRLADDIEREQSDSIRSMDPEGRDKVEQMIAEAGFAPVGSFAPKTVTHQIVGGTFFHSVCAAGPAKAKERYHRLAYRRYFVCS